MLRRIVGCAPWSEDWEQCTHCGYQTKKDAFSCPKCHDNFDDLPNFYPNRGADMGVKGDVR